MKQYKEYMDNIQASDTLHQRLLNLEAPAKRPAAWKKYGGMAAVLLLVCGLGGFGAWAAHISSLEKPLPPYPAGYQENRPELGGPDIATAAPGEDVRVRPNTIGGYEVTDGEVAAYFVLPYIEYGMSKDVSEMALDWDVPPGSVKRELARLDFAALFRSADALSTHLGWGGYELTGWAAWRADGSFWGAYLQGYKGPLDHFEFAFTAGDAYPPACTVYGDGKVNELWWGTPVTAYGYDGEDGCSRRVEFLKEGYGFRFDITATETDAACDLTSRLVRYLCDYGTFNDAQSSFLPDALSADGAVLAHPYEADPSYSVGEPNWNDSADDYDSDCPYCADGTVHTHPHTPGLPS